MQTLRLAKTGKQTSRLGFGCSSVMGGAMGRASSLRLLEQAFDAGIRHFDVAPMYGYGAAEGCLGEFLARHRGEVTVTTKYGILPLKRGWYYRLARHMATPVVKLLPKRKLADNGIASAISKASFKPGEAAASLECSLRKLRTDHIDVLLLHEVEATELDDDRFLGFLKDAVQSGKIGAFGCGSSVGKVPDLYAIRPEYCSVLQFEWSVLDTSFDTGTAFTIHHRALSKRFTELKAMVQNDKALCKKWSTAMAIDLMQPDMLAILMLKAALVFRPNSLILMSSRNPQHIVKNVEIVADDSLIAPARVLYELTQFRRESALHSI